LKVTFSGFGSSGRVGRFPPLLGLSALDPRLGDLLERLIDLMDLAIGECQPALAVVEGLAVRGDPVQEQSDRLSGAERV
jgi:hypothetical protein